MALSFVCQFAHAGFPDTVSIGKNPLILNGTGLRRVTIFGIRVYEAALYLTQKNTDAHAIIESANVKHVRMKFLRNVSANQIRKAWTQSLNANCEPYCIEVAPTFEEIKKIVPDVSEGSIMEFDFLGDRVVVRIDGKIAGEIKGGNFSKVFLSTWIGPHAPSEELKRGMLGLPEEN